MRRGFLYLVAIMACNRPVTAALLEIGGAAKL
jgi:hypothetical protein